MVNYVEEIVSSLIALVFGAITWLVRTVLTNQKQIALLQSEIESRDKRREEDRQILLQLQQDFKSEMRETREDIEEVRSELLQVWKQK